MQDDAQTTQAALAEARKTEQPPVLLKINNGLRVVAEPPKSWPRPPSTSRQQALDP